MLLNTAQYCSIPVVTWQSQRQHKRIRSPEPRSKPWASFGSSRNEERTPIFRTHLNTDATYLSELGPIWLVGPGDIEHAHSDAEHITLESLRAGVDLYEELGRSVLEAV